MDRPLRIYLWLALGITWGVGGLGLLAGAFWPQFALTASNPLYYIAAFGPSVAAMIMVGRLNGWPGLRRLLMRAAPRWAGLPWYVAVIVGFPAATLLAVRVVVPDILANIPRWDRLLYLLAFTAVADPGPLGEEFGWRGFALPRLLTRWSPLTAAFILGLIWFAWHLPAFFISTLNQSHISMPPFLLNSLALSVLMTWLYVRTGGDLLLMILFHLMANYCVEVLGVPFNAELAAEVVCAAMILAAGGLREAPRLRD